jgi:hypothetical protein
MMGVATAARKKLKFEVMAGERDDLVAAAPGGDESSDI